MGRHHFYSRRIQKQIQTVYIGAAVLWILGCYALRVQKAKSYIAYFIIAIPLIAYALGFLSSTRTTRKVENAMLSTDLLTFGLLFVSILLEMANHNSKHYTVPILVVALGLLVLSTIDFWTGECGLIISKHIRSAARTAAITLSLYVVYVNIVNGTPMRQIISANSIHKIGEQRTEEERIIDN